MTDTPARDALICRWADAIFVDRLLANPALVLAALIESGWRPDDVQLRAMGGTPSDAGMWVGWWRFLTAEEATR